MRTKRLYQKAKLYVKGGWKIYDANRKLEEAILDHYNALIQNGTSEICISDECSTNELRYDTLFSRACSDYAQHAMYYIKDKVIESLGASLTGLELNGIIHFLDYYIYAMLNMSEEIKGCLNLSFSVFRTAASVGYEYVSYFSVNEESARNVRVKALESAMQKSNVAQKYAVQLSEFVEYSPI